MGRLILAKLPPDSLFQVQTLGGTYPDVSLTASDLQMKGWWMSQSDANQSLQSNSLIDRVRVSGATMKELRISDRVGQSAVLDFV